MHDQKMLAVLKNLVGACLSAVFVSWKVETAKRRVRHAQIDRAILSHVSIGNRQNLKRILQGWWQRTRLGLDEGRKIHKIRKLIHYHVFNECLKMWWEHVLLSRVGRVIMMIGRMQESKHEDLVIACYREWVRFTLKSRRLRAAVEMFTGNRAEIKLRDYSLHWRAVAAASTLQKAGFGTSLAKSVKAKQIKSIQRADSFMGLQRTESFKSAQTTESFNGVQRVDSFTRSESGSSTRSSASRIPKGMAWVQRTGTPDSTSTVHKDVDIEDLKERLKTAEAQLQRLGVQGEMKDPRNVARHSILGSTESEDVSHTTSPVTPATPATPKGQSQHTETLTEAVIERGHTKAMNDAEKSLTSQAVTQAMDQEAFLRTLMRRRESSRRGERDRIKK
jgi:hypothetical protein